MRARKQQRDRTQQTQQVEEGADVVDKNTLEKAIASPDEYKDLVVRIGGYSDYFVKLSPQMQQEVILRTEHEI